MGQAKARGTFEQRKAEAIKANEDREQAARMVRQQLGQRRGKSRLNLAIAAAVASSGLMVRIAG